MSDTNDQGVVVFGYNFVHKKTQDFLFRMFAEGIPIRSVIAADPVKLNIPASSIRSKIRHTGVMHPRDVASAIGADYVVMPHRGEEIVEYLGGLRPEIGVIAGARILRAPVIDSFSKGVVNFHPGLIPEARGLDALYWGIVDQVPLAVTSHLIDSRVDAGDLLEVRKLPLFRDDTLFDLSERLYETQLDMLGEAIEKTRARDTISIDYSSSTCNRKMPPEMEATVEGRLAEYLEKFGS